MRGYAYAGGGRRVTRVEISFDDGCAWSLAHITYPEDLFRAVVHSDPIYGSLDLTASDTCFCWCFWSFEAPLTLLKASAAVMVRCMDESMAIQPRDMYWNATGMMNNWYVVG
jgi:nitrate reductase (NAD(P)H)